MDDGFLAVFALVCSSFVTISAGTHKRTPWAPLGDPRISMVLDGNQFASRTLDQTCVLDFVTCWYPTCLVKFNVTKSGHIEG